MTGSIEMTGRGGRPARWLVMLALAAVVLAGLFVRLHDLDAKTMRQDETYVPGLSLPPGVSDPAPRMTVLATLTGTMWDVHPPTWYVGMLAWTRVVGTSLFMLRLPAALFGALAILLTFFLARSSAGDDAAALLAAALVAFNGHQLLWSQIARQYTYVLCVGLTATLALSYLLDARRRGRTWLALYAGATLLGLYSLYYYWVLVAAQLIWTIACARLAERTRLALVKVQVFLCILATPVLSIAVFQSRDSYLEDNVVRFTSDYLRFGFLLEGDTAAGMFAVLAPLGLIGALALAAVGVWQGSGSNGVESAEDAVPDLPLWLVAVCAAGAAAAMLGEAVVFRSFKPERFPALVGAAALPVAALAGYLVLVSPFFARLRIFGMGSSLRLSLVAGTALIPVPLLALITLATPFLASKGMLIITPYLLIVLALGGRALVGRSLPRTAAALAGVVLLVILHGHSLALQADRTGPQDYAGLAREWAPRLQDGDTLFAARDWATTGVFYYIDGRRYHLVPGQYEKAAQGEPARVWLLCRPGLRATTQMYAALAGYRQTESYAARGLWVELWERF